jgi:hypothetical protein
MALRAERYQVTQHVLITKPFIGSVMNFEPPLAAVV